MFQLKLGLDPGLDVDQLSPRVNVDDLPDVAICFLKVPPARLEAGLAVMRTWGFHYQTCIAADLPNPPGHADANLWFTSKLDLILIGVRGGLPEIQADKPLDSPIDRFVKAALAKKVSEWLPDVEIRTIE